MPLLPLAIDAFISCGICCDCGFTIPAWTRGLSSTPYIVDGITIYVLTYPDVAKMTILDIPRSANLGYPPQRQPDPHFCGAGSERFSPFARGRCRSKSCSWRTFQPHDRSKRLEHLSRRLPFNNANVHQANLYRTLGLKFSHLLIYQDMSLTVCMRAGLLPVLIYLCLRPARMAFVDFI